MSCFKCGKELPEGQVECEDGCKSRPLDNLPKITSTDLPIIGMTLFVNVEKVHENKEGYFKAVERFNNMLQEALVISGLAKFVKED